MKKLVRILLVLILCCSMCSCTFIGFIYNDLLYDETTKAEMNSADEFAREFLSLISNGEIEEAEKYIHPQFFEIEETLTNYLASMEERESIEFSQGVYIERTRSKNKSSDYFFIPQYTYHGYTITYDVLIGTVPKTCRISICDNDDGYGIYQLIFVN